MSIKKTDVKKVKEVLSGFGKVTKNGSTFTDGSVEGFSTNIKKELDGADLRKLAELTETAPVEVKVKRSGAGLKISVN